MKQLSLILIGGGDRGSSYLKYLDSDSDKFRFVSCMSHLICFATEKARKEDIVIDMKEYIESL